MHEDRKNERLLSYQNKIEAAIFKKASKVPFKKVTPRPSMSAHFCLLGSSGAL
jgi:hypothetical protein